MALIMLIGIACFSYVISVVHTNLSDINSYDSNKER
jgi:hypothetical protein